MTIGKRLFEARRSGYPFIVVVGDLAAQSPPLYEIYDLVKNERHNLTESELLHYVKDNLTHLHTKKNIRLYTNK